MYKKIVASVIRSAKDLGRKDLAGVYVSDAAQKTAISPPNIGIVSMPGHTVQCTDGFRMLRIAFPDTQHVAGTFARLHGPATALRTINFERVRPKPYTALLSVRTVDLRTAIENAHRARLRAFDEAHELVLTSLRGQIENLNQQLAPAEPSILAAEKAARKAQDVADREALARIASDHTLALARGKELATPALRKTAAQEARLARDLASRSVRNARDERERARKRAAAAKQKLRDTRASKQAHLDRLLSDRAALAVHVYLDRETITIGGSSWRCERGERTDAERDSRPVATEWHVNPQYLLDGLPETEHVMLLLGRSWADPLSLVSAGIGAAEPQTTYVVNPLRAR